MDLHWFNPHPDRALNLSADPASDPDLDPGSRPYQIRVRLSDLYVQFPYYHHTTTKLFDKCCLLSYLTDFEVVPVVD